MIEETARKAASRERRSPVMLRGATVMKSFRDDLFDVSNRAGMSVNEFVLMAAAEKLKRSGRQFSGVFKRGDADLSQAAR